MSYSVFCTVFTPTYNRANCLAVLYDSLKSQEEKDFEWLIVDDGSDDNTEEVVTNFIMEKCLSIRYIKTINGGKHRAINKGVQLAKGKVFAIVDSDDYLTKTALLKIKEWFKEIEGSKRLYAGVGGAKGFSEKSMIGTGHQAGTIFVDAKNTERRKYGINGDKFEIFYTSVLQQYPFPEIEGEKFLAEQVVWTRIANNGYYIRWYNDIICICEYLEGGLTNTRLKVASQNPKGYALYIKQEVKIGCISLKQKLGYYSFYYKIRKGQTTIKRIAQEIDTNVVILFASVILRKLKYIITREKDEK